VGGPAPARMGRKGRGAGLPRRDPVLGARVRELLASGAVAKPATSERVYEVLVARFREYARRAPATVRKDISRVVIEQRKARELAKGAAGAGGGGGGDDDEDGSVGDSSDDGEEELGDGPVHNMLNASLYAGVKRPRSESEVDSSGAPTPAKPPSLFGHLLSSTSKPASSAAAAQAPSAPTAPAAPAAPAAPCVVAGAPSTALEGRQRAVEQASARKQQQQQQQQQHQQQQPFKKRARGASGGDAAAVGPSSGAQGLGAASPNDLQAERPTVRFSDMGGIDSCLQDVRELCEYPLTHPEIYRHLGVEPPRGILLHGPPGCGKTMLARAIAGEMDCSFFSVSAPEIVSGMSGESEEKLRKLFDAARAAAPAIVFIDEIDAITGKREESSRGMERRIVAQLLICMDSLRSDKDSSKDKDGASAAADADAGADAARSEEGGPEVPDHNKNNVLVIGATNRPDALDPALRRAGRFDREIAMGIPDATARARILRCITTGMRLAGDFDFDEIARNTPGFVGADLDALAKEAAVVAVNRVFFEITRAARGAGAGAGAGGDSALSDEDAALVRRAAASEALRNLPHPLTKEQLDPVFVRMEDFWEAVKKVQPSAKREGFATVPSVTWDDIGSLASVRGSFGLGLGCVRMGYISREEREEREKRREEKRDEREELACMAGFAAAAHLREGPATCLDEDSCF
jgi:ribosome biogenesis ATPase